MDKNRDMLHGAAKVQIRALLGKGSEFEVQRARKQILAELSKHPYDAELHNLNAHALLKLGQAQEAVAASKTAVALCPRDPAYLYTAGTVQLIARLFPEAVESFTAVLAVNPSNVDAVVHLAYARAWLGGVEAGRVAELLDRTEASSPRLEALPLLAFAALRTGWVERALKTVVTLWGRVTETDPPTDWGTGLVAVPDEFFCDRFKGAIVRPGRPDVAVSDLLLMAKRLLERGMRREEVFATIRALVTDAPAEGAAGAPNSDS